MGKAGFRKSIVWMIAGFALVLFGGAWGRCAVPDQISFQGRLTDLAGNPVDDRGYTMQFFLYSAGTGGTALWSSPPGGTLVFVENGIYNVMLGAGSPLSASVFESGTVWLEVIVDGETLSPRQPVAAVAYALKAGDADTLEGSPAASFALAGHNHDTEYVNEGQAGSVNSDMIRTGAVTSDNVADNSIMAADLAANSVGNSELAPNSVTESKIATNAVTADKIAAGAVGSSEIANGSVLAADMADGAALAEILDNDGPGSGLNADYLDNFTSSYFMPAATDNWVNESGDTMTGQLNITNSGTGLYSSASTAATTVYGVRVDANQSSANNYTAYGLYSDTDSTATSAYTYGTYSNAAGNHMTYGLYSTANSATATAYGLYASSYAQAGTTYGVYSYANQPTGNNSDVYAYQGYAYGRGTGDLWASRNYAFHYGTGEDGGDTVGVQSLAYGSDYGTAYGVYAIAANGASNYGGYFATSVDAGIPVVGLQSGSYTIDDLGSYYAPGGFFGGRNGIIGFSEADYGYGIVGLSTGVSTSGVYAKADGNNAYGVRAYAYANGTDENNARGVYGSAYGPDAMGGYFYASGTDAVGVYGQATAYAGDFYGDLRVRGSSQTASYLLVDHNEDTNGPSLKLYNSDGDLTIELDAGYGGPDGRIITDELQITGGSDLSEQFDVTPVDIEVGPGMVVSIDPDNPGNLLVSSTAYDNKVAGIISGANGIKPGMMMGQRGTKADGKHPVALTGRVYCRADASQGPIRPGDLLTTSWVPGHAMKVTDHTKANGAILGKAMTALNEGKGMVLVLVSLQ